MNNGMEIQGILRDLEQISVVRIAVIVLVAWGAVLLVQRVLPRLLERLPARLRLRLLPLVPVLRLVILLVAFLKVVPLVVDPTPQNILAILGAMGLAMGFAFKDYAGSVIAGIVSLYERPYRVGDWVRIGDAYGVVKSLGLRSLKLVTPDDTAVTVPHARIWNENISNANDGYRELLCVADFYLHPAHDARSVRERLWEVGITSPYTKLDRPVSVMVHETPWATHYRLKAYPVDGREQFRFVTDLTTRGKEALAELGAEPPMLPASKGDFTHPSS